MPGTFALSAASPQRRKRKRRPASAARGWTWRYASVAYLVVAVALVLEGLLISLLIPRGATRVGVGGILIDATMLACLIPLYRRRAFRARDLGLRGAAPARSVGWVTLAVVVIAIVNLLWLQDLLGFKAPDSLGITLHGSTFGLLTAGFVLCLSAPVVEEIFFRGFFYRALRNTMSVPRAAVIAGILFGLIHALAYPLDTLPPRMVFGVIACLLYERTGSLLPGIALHCLIDAGGFEAAVTGHNRIVFSTFAGLAVVLLIYAAVRRLWTPSEFSSPLAAAGPRKGPSTT